MLLPACFQVQLTSYTVVLPRGLAAKMISKQVSILLVLFSTSRGSVALLYSCLRATENELLRNRTFKRRQSALFANYRGPDDISISSKVGIGPTDPKPDYESIYGPMGKDVDALFLAIFKEKMAQHVMGGELTSVTAVSPGYEGLMELTEALNARYSNRTQVIAQDILRSLFPSWLPRAFSVMFAQPFPKFSSRMNAWATKLAGTWLMGECEINDTAEGERQGLLVKRCRFLEESNCASICVNCCKIPTQNFFLQDMGLPLTMTPDYNTFECQFSFGKMPDPAEEIQAKQTPCLAKCPSAGRLRKWHTNGQDNIKLDFDTVCSLMDNAEQDYKYINK
jgi:hypothetical protein